VVTDVLYQHNASCDPESGGNSSSKTFVTSYEWRFATNIPILIATKTQNLVDLNICRHKEKCLTANQKPCRSYGHKRLLYFILFYFHRCDQTNKHRYNINIRKQLVDPLKIVVTVCLVWFNIRKLRTLLLERVKAFIQFLGLTDGHLQWTLCSLWVRNGALI